MATPNETSFQIIWIFFNLPSDCDEMKSHRETVSLIQQLWSVPAERVAALATFAKVVVKTTTTIHGPDNSIGIHWHGAAN